MSGDFVWRDAGRTVEFRHGGAVQAVQILREQGFFPFELLATPRALAGAGELAEAAEAVHELGPGLVAEASAELLGRVSGPRLVALGGGRTIDSAKAIAAVEALEVAAVPTTLSGAEMTAIHRLPAAARAKQGVRPQLVVADPLAMASQPEAQLRASAMNALAHGADSLCTPFANPLSRLAAVRGAGLISHALDQEREERNRAALAEGAILSGYAIDSGLFGVHHVICQTLAQRRRLPHAETNAALLPVTLEFLAAGDPRQLADFLAALDTRPDGVAARVRELGGEPAGLGALGLSRDGLEEVVAAVLSRPEIAYAPEPPGREQVEAMIAAAW